MADFTMKAGDTAYFLCTFTDSETAGTPPIDLTGFSIDCDLVRLSSGARDTFTAAIIDAAGGLATLGATAAETALWSPGLYRSDIRLTQASGVSTSGSFLIEIQEAISDGS